MNPIQQLLDEQEQAREQPAREVQTLSNAAYRRICEEQLDADVREIVKRYQDAASEVWKYSVRAS